MRDINRIDKVCAALAEQWKRVPDWRLGQLLVNVQRTFGTDLFYTEDNLIVGYVRDTLDELKVDEY